MGGRAMQETTRDALAFAADVSLARAIPLYREISPYMGWAKVGLSLYVEHGPAAVEAFLDLGARVFLDLKLHDIPNTVRLAAARAGALGVDLLTVHATGGREMIRAAVEGAAEGAASRGHAAPRVLAVTVLTSFSPEALAEVGLTAPVPDTVRRLAQLALSAGAGGVVCSPDEAAMLRAQLGPSAFLCTPGVRPLGASRGDQARAQTPSATLKAGSDLLVVGRPVHGADDPVLAARAIAEELEGLT